MVPRGTTIYLSTRDVSPRPSARLTVFDEPDRFEHDAHVWTEQARGFESAARAADAVAADTTTAATDAVWKGPMPDDRLARMAEQAADAARAAEILAEMAAACRVVAGEAAAATAAIDEIRREWDDANLFQRIGLGGDADDVRGQFSAATSAAREALADLADRLQPVIDRGDPLDFLFTSIVAVPGGPHLGEQLDEEAAAEYFDTGELVDPADVDEIENTINDVSTGDTSAPDDWHAWAETNGYSPAEVQAALDNLDAEERAALNQWLDGNRGDPNHTALGLTSFLWQTMRSDQVEEFHRDVPNLEPRLREPADEWLQMIIDMHPDLDLDATGFEDIAQGSLGDCTTLASLAAVAAANPGWFDEHIRDNDNGTFTVTVYDPDGNPVDVVVSSYLPGESGNLSYNGRDTRAATWAAIYEKAMAQYQGGDYEKIDGFWPADLMPTVTGRDNDVIPLEVVSPSPEDLMTEIEGALAENRSITVVWNVPGGGLHTLAVVGVDEDGHILVANPWPNRDLLRLTPEEFLQEDYVHMVVDR